MKYFGIADAHGIESFIKGDPSEDKNSQQAMILHLRAGANRQRHAVVYVVDIPEEVAEEVDDLIINGRYIDALNHLKGSVKELQLRAGDLSRIQIWIHIARQDLSESAWVFAWAFFVSRYFFVFNFLRFPRKSGSRNHFFNCRKIHTLAIWKIRIY